jgi:hypothetical protein
MENHDRPLVSITAKKDGYTPRIVRAPDRVSDRWMDVEYVIRSSRERFASTFFGAEAYPDLWPNLGPDILGAILGDEIEFGENTSWSKHTLNEWSRMGKFKFDSDNKWLKKIKEMTQIIVMIQRGIILSA